MIALLIVASLSASGTEARPVYGPVMRPRVERVEDDGARRYLAAEPEQGWLDEGDDGVQVKWRGRKVKLRVPLG